MRYLSVILLFIAFSCATSKMEYVSTYTERSLSFFDPYEQTWIDEQNVGHVYEHWIREPINIKTLHETFKKIGYKNLISEEDRFSTIVNNWLFIRKPMNELLDSLILTYTQDSINSKYYREFWNRREGENNKEVVFEILSEVTSELYEDHQTKLKKEFVNDTLFNLIQIRELSDTITLELAMQHFTYLKNTGMHQSAYNLLFETYGYSHITWNREELLKQLIVDSVKCCPTPWIADNTK